MAESLALLPESDRSQIIRGLTGTELATLEHDWKFWARPKQLAPPGDWLTWLLRTGRGFGKTRSGGGWTHSRAMEWPGRWCALVAKTPADARDVMIEGPAGILKNTSPHERPIYESSKRRITWPNGSWGTIYSSEEADQLRGFSGDTAWLDEFGKYSNPREVWDNLQFGMREVSADFPRVCVTTTPRPLPILEEIQARSTTVTVTGSSYENRANLAPTWFAETLAAYEGTRLGRQEIHGELLDDVEGRVYASFVNLPYPLGNVDASVADTGAEILVGQDFNVNPMASVIAVRVADECHVLDSLEVDTSNTTEVCEEIKRRYPTRHVVFCPDPSGKARKTSAAGQTDFSIIRSFGFEVRAPNSAPLVRDRENNSNAMFLQGNRRRVRIHPRAKAYINALNNLTYKEGTSIRDKGSGFDHICDAGDYLLWQEFNVLTPTPAWGTSKWSM
ncbi:MAG: DNA-packaging protein [Chthoniobacterales bacterium]|nr:DNA-packaging protein [Chthoniobacterales bacterium]